MASEGDQTLEEPTSGADEGGGPALEERVRHQVAVAEFGRAALRATSEHEVLELAARLVCEGLDAARADVVEVVGDDVVPRAAAGSSLPEGPELAATLAQIALRTDEPLITFDAESDTRFDWPEGLGARSLVVAPITTRQRSFGCVCVFAEREHRFSSEDVFFVQSLTQVLSAALEREESETMFSAVFEGAPDAIVITEARSIVAANPAALELFGRPLGDLLGKVAEELSADPSGVRARLLRQRVGEVVETGVLRPNGEIRTVELSFRALEGSDRRVNIFRDVTERRRLQDQLVQSQKLEVVGQLSAGVAHDFNNLLLAVRGLGDLVLQELPEDSPVREDVEAIRLAGERGMEIVDRLLRSTRRAVPSARAVSPEDVLQEADALIRQLLPEDVDLQIALDAGSGNVFADAGELQHVVINLVVNARDAMPKGGRVSISLSQVAIDENRGAELGIAADLYNVLSVSDTGIGMDEETRSRIFEPFFTTKPAGTGSGLGLSMVYGFAQAASGAVVVESRPGEGATFALYLPDVEEAHHEASKASESLPQGQGTVLVVDYDELSRYVTGRALEELGYEVVMVSSGDEAIEIATQLEDLAAIVTDVVMPGLAGPELLQDLHALLPRTPILIISGHSDDMLVQRGISGDEWPLLAKPFTPEELGHALLALTRAAPQ